MKEAETELLMKMWVKTQKHRSLLCYIMLKENVKNFIYALSLEANVPALVINFEF